MRSQRPIRVLHVLGSLNRGGVETWLMHVLSHSDLTRVQPAFLVHDEQPGVLDDDARSLGAAIYPCPSPARPWRYVHNFRRIVHEHGPFDVVHSHVHHFSGFVLELARHEGIPVRIAHSHSDTRSVDRAGGIARGCYLAMTEWLVHRNATVRVGVSSEAASALFGAKWQHDPCTRILPYGIDLTPFKEPVGAAALRESLGIPGGAHVVGHVGRFDAVKNHGFIVDLAPNVVQRDPSAIFLLVGAGPLKESIQRRVRAEGLEDRFVFAGLRSDVPRLLLGAMDALVLPSFYEGLPVVGIEAQAAGLPIVLSDSITREVVVVPGTATYLPLSAGVTAWAAAIVEAIGRPRIANPLVHLEQGPFDISRTIADLSDFYADPRTRDVPGRQQFFARG